MSAYNEAENFYEAADPHDDFDDLDSDPNLEGVDYPEVPSDQDPPEDIVPGSDVDIQIWIFDFLWSTSVSKSNSIRISIFEIRISNHNFETH